MNHLNEAVQTSAGQARDEFVRGVRAGYAVGATWGALLTALLGAAIQWVLS